MLKFVFGFIAGLVVALLGIFLWVRLGFVNPRADVPENVLEKYVAMPSLDAAVDRRAPEVRNPLQVTDANLIAGMKTYETNCASCHGDTRRPDSMLPDALYPRAPLFVKDAPDMPENQNFYIIDHGVRLSGMPAWKKVLNEQQIWQVTTFLSHMDKLPPEVLKQWQAVAGAAETTPQSK